MILPFIVGVLGSMASVAGKFDYKVLMVAINLIMMVLFNYCLKTKQTVKVTAAATLGGYVSNYVFGYIIFNEKHGILYFLGLTLMFIGSVIS